MSEKKYTRIFRIIPPIIEKFPLFMGIAGGINTSSFILNMPKAFSANDRLDKVPDNIKEGFVPA